MNHEEGIRRILAVVVLSFVVLPIVWLAATGTLLLLYILSPAFVNAGDTAARAVTIISNVFVGYLLCCKAIPWIASGFRCPD